MEQACIRGRAATLVALAALWVMPVPGNVARAEHDWEWRNPLPQGGALECVAGGGDQWLAIGDGTTLLRSDGAAEQWALEPENNLPSAHFCTAMAYADGVWLVALEDWLDGGRLLRSTDGRHWEPVREGAVHGMIFHDDRFIGVGQKPGTGGTAEQGRFGFVATSRDGLHWDADVELPEGMRDVAATANRYVAVGGAGAVFTSADALEWAPADSGTDAWLYSVAHGAERFVAVGAHGAVLASDDGRRWQRIDSGTDRNLYRVRHAAGRFVAVGAEGVMLESGDGLNWSATTSLRNNNTLFDVATTGEQFVAVGAAGEIYTRASGQSWSARTHKATGDDTPHRHLRRVAYGEAGFVAVGSAGSVLHSTDGAAWEARAGGSTDDLWGVAYGAQAYVAVGSQGTVLRSDDGSTWTQHRAGGDLAAVAHGAQGFVAVGAEGRIERSADGVTWEAVPAGTTARLFDVAYGSQGYVVAAEDGFLLHSADGDRWEVVSTENAGPLTRVAWGNGRYVAIAPDYGYTQVLHSTDGRLWVRVATLEPELHEVAFNADTGEFVASGYDPVRGAALQVSADAASWTEHPLAANHIRSLVAAGGTLIGVGDTERIIQAGTFSAAAEAAPTGALLVPLVGLRSPPSNADQSEVGRNVPDIHESYPEVGLPGQEEDSFGADGGNAVPRVAAGGGCAAGAPGRLDPSLLALVLGAALSLTSRAARARVRLKTSPARFPRVTRKEALDGSSNGLEDQPEDTQHHQ